ncbi:MAG: glycosyltransferase, partial [Caldimonas sp.]
RPNLHWLGQQPYGLLPQLVAGWDVCLMPFALNESTEFISPTKTLEYMAAGKPVVSTPIHDVKAMFGDLVAIAGDAGAFIAACRRAVAEAGAETQAREARMASRVGEHSWDQAAGKILAALDAVLAAKPNGDDALPARTGAGPALADGEPPAADAAGNPTVAAGVVPKVASAG